MRCEPPAYLILKAAAAGIMYRKTFRYNGVGSKLRDRGQALSEAPSSVTAERHYGLAGQVILLKERCDWHRYRGPPVRIAQNNYVVAGDIRDMIFELRPRLDALIALRFFEHGIVVFRIGLLGLYLKYIGAALLQYLLCDAAGRPSP